MSLFETLGLGARPEEDNAVSYVLYPDGELQNLQALRMEALQLLEAFLRSFVWHKDEFELEDSTVHVPPWLKQRKWRKGHGLTKTEPEPACLWGVTRFGDNIEDEWVVVSLLMQLSIHLPVSIQVWDNDGQFMLIEAAYALPRWLKPDVSTNRVWLRHGQLHIIPQPSATCPDLPPFPSVNEALAVMRTPSPGVETHAPRVETIVKQRLGNLPEGALQQLIAAAARVPVPIAAALHQDPQLISMAVEAFFYRDSDDMRAAARMTHFSLQGAQDFADTNGSSSGLSSQDDEGLVTVPVRLGACQHAQLLQQRFSAPRGVPMPSASQQPELYAAAELGLKLTSGFEILWARAARVGGLPGQVQQLPSASTAVSAGSADSSSGAPASIPAAGCLTEKQLQQMPAWHTYLALLEQRNYFHGNIVGSARYKELMNKAILDFCCSPLLPRGTKQVADPVLRTLRALDAARNAARHAGCSGLQQWLEMCVKTEYSLQQTTREQALSQMEQQAAKLELELAKRQNELEEYSSKYAPAGTRPESKANSSKAAAGPSSSTMCDTGDDGDDGACKEQVLEAADLVARFSTFVSAMSGPEGAEVPRAQRPVALDAERVLSQLKQTLGMSAHSHGLDEGSDNDSSEGSSFFSDDGDDDDDVDDDNSGFMAELERQMREATGPSRSSQQDGQPRPPHPPHTPKPRAGGKLQELEEAWEVCTATDSDDPDAADGLSIGGSEGDDDSARPMMGPDGFDDMYSHVLEEQLRDTKMAETFERAQDQQDCSSPPAFAGQAHNDALRPVDLDVNLVKNLLRSAAAQHGLAGPATNMAGILGLDLPHGMDEADVA